MKISTSQFRNGLKIIINAQPCSILEHEFHKPGKGQAVMRVKFRNLITGKVIDKTYKSGESVEEADVMTVEMSYLYSDGEQWHFMNSSTYEQIAINTDVVGDAKKWIIGQEICSNQSWIKSIDCYVCAFEAARKLVGEKDVTQFRPGISPPAEIAVGRMSIFDVEPT